MKRLGTLLIAIALVFGMTQCKKKSETIDSVTPMGTPVHITVNVTEGSKHIVYPGSGAVVYTDHDIVYVGNNGKYIGQLEYEDGKFSGTIYGPSTEDYLHFYFIGGLNPSTTPSAGSTTDFTVSIANQRTNLPVLAYGKSHIKYTSESTTYACILENKCGLVKFNLGKATYNDVTINGMKTTAKIDFENNGIVAQATTGEITLYSGESTTTRWAILLPQSVVENPTVSIDGFDAIIAFVPEVQNNTYYNSGVIVNMDVDPYFSVSSTKKVYFSPGNLQYKASTGTWRFAENAWDYVGGHGGWPEADYGTVYENEVKCDNRYIASDYSGWIDLFGWGTWTGNTPTPYQSSMSDSDYVWDSNDFKGTISGDDNTWFTMTKAEWDYLLAREGKKSYATVCGTPGLLLLSDGFVLPVNCSYTADVLDNWTSNTYDEETWPYMQESGAVFLPASGQRSGTSLMDMASCGMYYTSSLSDFISGGELYSPYYLTFKLYDENTPGEPIAWATMYRHDGFSVRLVREKK